jgi:tRNA threonylcarbamoyladenosine modification (KEOPS) complex Cgi121 subunit
MKQKTYYFHSLHFSIMKAVKEFGQKSNISKTKNLGKVPEYK